MLIILTKYIRQMAPLWPMPPYNSLNSLREIKFFTLFFSELTLSQNNLSINNIFSNLNSD